MAALSAPGFQDRFGSAAELGVALISALRWGARHKMFDPGDMPSIDLPPPGQAAQQRMTIPQEEEF